jgi:hypothetical protein
MIRDTLSGLNLITGLSCGLGKLSTAPRTVSPAPISSISWQALVAARRHPLISIPFSNLAEDSERRPSFFEVLWMLAGLNQADSISTDVVPSVISVSRPPITPAMATARPASPITSISGFNSLSTSSREYIFSPGRPLLTIIAWS